MSARRIALYSFSGYIQVIRRAEALLHLALGECVMPPTAFAGKDPAVQSGAFELVVGDVEDVAVGLKPPMFLLTAVLTGATGVELRYAVRWEAFHACSGQSAAGVSQRVARGRADGGDWVFARHVPPPARDGVDEF